MTIEYLQKLRDTAQVVFSNEGISELEIEQLEQLYNSGNLFPQVLKEMLFLAGKYCEWLDFSFYDSQQELQDNIRAELLTIFRVTVSRPFFVIETIPDGTFIFMYLNEGDNPPLYHSNYLTQDNFAAEQEKGKGSLKFLIEKRIELYLEGFNPF